MAGRQQRAGNGSAGFTLVEVLVAAALLAAAMAIVLGAYFNVVRAWQRGLGLADRLNHGDYLMEQVVSGLRCAYYPPPATNRPRGGSDYGFWLEKSGSDADARDTFSWVKTGTELLCPDSALAGGLHRVRVGLEADAAGRLAVGARAWRPYANPDDFAAGSLEPFFISGQVLGLACRVSTNRAEQGWEWETTWENEATNRLPLAVEITLFLEPPAPGDPAVELRRLVEIPVAPFSWRRGQR